MRNVIKLSALALLVGAVISFNNKNAIKQVKAAEPAAKTGNIHGDGEYYIFLNDISSSIDMTVGSSNISNVAIEDATPWNFSKDGDYYHITKEIDSVTYTLAAIDNDSGLRILPTYKPGKIVINDSWTYDANNQKLSVMTDRTNRSLGYNRNTSTWTIAYNNSNSTYKVDLIRADIYDGFVSQETKASLRLSYTEEESNYSINNLGLRFGGSISKDLKEELDSLENSVVTYGVKYSYTPVSTGINKSGRTNTGAYVSNFGDREAVDKNDANFYQFFLSINNFPMNELDTEITAKCYITIENSGVLTEYLMSSKTYSVKQMIDVYLGDSSPLTNEEKSNYSDVLNYIKNYEA